VLGPGDGPINISRVGEHESLRHHLEMGDELSCLRVESRHQEDVRRRRRRRREV